MRINSPKIRFILVLIITAATYFFLQNKRTNNEDNEIPKYVIETLNYVEKHQKAPEGYVGGRRFFNREKQLPEASQGTKIKYQEWDVHPKIEGQNRGAERLVTSSDKHAYYTKNHYRTFVQIK